MKSFSVILVFILAAFSAVAQTDTNAIVVPVETNAPIVVFTGPADHPDTVAQTASASPKSACA